MHWPDHGFLEALGDLIRAGLICLNVDILNLRRNALEAMPQAFGQGPHDVGDCESID
jgi:hypothetical protein